MKTIFLCVRACVYIQAADTHPSLINIHAEWHSMLGSKHSPTPAVIQTYFCLPNSSILFKQGLNLPWNTAEFSCSSASGQGGTRVGNVPLSPAQWAKWGPSSFYLQQQWCRRLDTEGRTWNDPTLQGGANCGTSWIPSWLVILTGQVLH